MPKSVFVSYSHHQGEWVWDRLVPCLRAGGAEVLIDRERFAAGRAVVGQMDATQDGADVHVLVLSPEYLASDFCVHEMERAIATDPGFERGTVVPVRRGDCPLPDAVREPNPLYADLRDDGTAEPWELVLRACGADLGTAAPAWLGARDEVRRFLERGQSVNLVASEVVAWEPLVTDLRNTLPLSLIIVNLLKPGTASRRGLVEEILLACGVRRSVPSEPEDLVTLDRTLAHLPGKIYLALLNFDLTQHRPSYEANFFTSLRFLVVDEKKIVLLVHSHRSYSSLTPKEEPLSRLELKAVEIPAYPLRRIGRAKKPGEPSHVIHEDLPGDLSSRTTKEGRVRRFANVTLRTLENLLTMPRVIKIGPSQRVPAELTAIAIIRKGADIEGLAQLNSIFADIPTGKGFLRHIPSVRQEVSDIVLAQARLDILERPFLREPYALLLLNRIETFAMWSTRLPDPLGHELLRAARAWREVARRQLADARTRLEPEPTRQVFRAGDPVDHDQEAFVPRDGILAELERQVLLATGCPGLVIYGRRRLGKSTLLRNLRGFLPASVRVANLSMQQAPAFASLEHLIGLLAETLATTLPPGAAADPPPTDLRGLEKLLSSANSVLDGEGLRLLLALDEYENLDRKIGEGVLSEDLLAVVRESIQSHRRLIWAFAGSHRIDELGHAPWSSYLVSARTVEIPMFRFEETRLLLTEPLRCSTLWPKDDPSRPRFEPGFWGDGGIERIHREAGGWPHLVQLAAETVVDLVNDAGRVRADAELLEESLDRAVVRGDVVFRELLDRESTLPGEWDYLRAFRRREAQPPPADEAVERSLRRRLLIAEDGEHWRLRVPLMGRWLRQRG